MAAADSRDVWSAICTRMGAAKVPSPSEQDALLRAVNRLVIAQARVAVLASDRIHGDDPEPEEAEDGDPSARECAAIIPAANARALRHLEQLESRFQSAMDRGARGELDTIARETVKELAALGLARRAYVTAIDRFMAGEPAAPDSGRGQAMGRVAALRVRAAPTVHRLFEGHVKLIGVVLREAPCHPVERPALWTSGALGLLTAIERFDPDEGSAFTAAAKLWIKARMYRRYRFAHPRPQLSSERLADGILLLEARARYVGAEHIDLGALATAAGMSEGRAALWIRATRRPRSTKERGRLGGSLGDCVRQPGLPLPEEWRRLRARRESVEAAIETLIGHQRYVLDRRLALGVSERPTLDEVGREMGLSRERVRQIEREGEIRLGWREPPEKPEKPKASA